LLHCGDVVRVDHGDPSSIVHGVVASDRASAVMAYVQLTPSITTVPQPMRFAGIDPNAHYRIDLVDDLGSADEFGRVRPAWMDLDRLECSGQQLMTAGLQPPVMHAESVLLMELRAV